MLRRSGGVAVYVKSGVRTKVIKSSSGLKSEYLFFEVIFPNYKILFGAYYKAPDVDEIEEFDTVLTEFSSLYTDVIVMGVFNENLLVRDISGLCKKCMTSSCSVCRFANCLIKYGLKSIGEAPTNFDGQPSLIDFVVTNKPANFTAFSQIGSGLSNHDIVFATHTDPNMALETEKKTWRNYKAIDVDRLRTDVNNSNLNDIFSCTDVDSMVEIFDSVVVRLLDKHAPITLLKP